MWGRGSLATLLPSSSPSSSAARAKEACSGIRNELVGFWLQFLEASGCALQWTAVSQSISDEHVVLLRLQWFWPGSICSLKMDDPLLSRTGHRDPESKFKWGPTMGIHGLSRGPNLFFFIKQHRVMLTQLLAGWIRLITCKVRSRYSLPQVCLKLAQDFQFTRRKGVWSMYVRVHEPPPKCAS